MLNHVFSYSYSCIFIRIYIHTFPFFLLFALKKGLDFVQNSSLSLSAGDPLNPKNRRFFHLSSSPNPRSFASSPLFDRQTNGRDQILRINSIDLWRDRERERVPFGRQIRKGQRNQLRFPHVRARISKGCFEALVSGYPISGIGGFFVFFASRKNAVWIWGFWGLASVEESFGFRGIFCWIDFVGAIGRFVQIACKWVIYLFTPFQCFYVLLVDFGNITSAYFNRKESFWLFQG